MLKHFINLRIYLLLFIFIFLCDYVMALKDVPPPIVIMPSKIHPSHYEMLNRFLRPVLERRNDYPKPPKSLGDFAMRNHMKLEDLIFDKKKIPSNHKEYKLNSFKKKLTSQLPNKKEHDPYQTMKWFNKKDHELDIYRTRPTSQSFKKKDDEQDPCQKEPAGQSSNKEGPEQDPYQKEPTSQPTNNKAYEPDPYEKETIQSSNKKYNEQDQCDETSTSQPSFKKVYEPDPYDKETTTPSPKKKYYEQEPFEKMPTSQPSNKKAYEPDPYDKETTTQSSNKKYNEQDQCDEMSTSQQSNKKVYEPDPYEKETTTQSSNKKDYEEDRSEKMPTSQPSNKKVYEPDPYKKETTTESSNKKYYEQDQCDEMSTSQQSNKKVFEPDPYEKETTTQSSNKKYNEEDRSEKIPTNQPSNKKVYEPDPYEKETTTQSSNKKYSEPDDCEEMSTIQPSNKKVYEPDPYEKETTTQSSNKKDYEPDPYEKETKTQSSNKKYYGQNFYQKHHSSLLSSKKDYGQYTYRKRPIGSTKKPKQNRYHIYDDGTSYLKVLSTFINQKHGSNIDPGPIKKAFNKRPRASSDLEVNGDYNNQDIPDVGEAPANNFEHDRLNKPFKKDIGKEIVKSEETKIPDSLYEKFKANLGSLANILDIKTKSDNNELYNYIFDICKAQSTPKPSPSKNVGSETNNLERKKPESSPSHNDIYKYIKESRKPLISPYKDIFQYVLQDKRPQAYLANGKIKGNSTKNTTTPPFLEFKNPGSLPSNDDVSPDIMESKNPGSYPWTHNVTPNIVGFSSPKVEFKSLYDQFKKRLVAFSNELDIDSGLTDDKIPDCTRNDIMNIETSHDIAKPIENSEEIQSDGDHLTAEFKKVLNVVDTMGKDTSINVNQGKRSQPAYSKKKKNALLSNSANVHEIDAGRKPASTGGFINNDYNDEDSYRPLPIFRKLDVPFRKRIRPLRGIETMNKNYLTWANTQGTDGSSYSKVFPTLYSDSVNKHLSAVTLLDDIAHKLNTSTIDIARKVAGIKELNLATLEKDPELHKLLQDYIESTVLSAAKSIGAPVTAKTDLQPTPATTITIQQIPSKESSINCQASLQSSDSIKDHIDMDSLKSLPQHTTTIDKDPLEMPALTPIPDATINNSHIVTQDQLNQILDKLTNKLSEIKSVKNDSYCYPLEDFPCRLNGSWTSRIMGLQFNIAFKDKEPIESNMILQESSNHPLTVSIEECVPPKVHDVLGTDWPITGSALKETGGPFFFYTQKRSENLLGTFVGYCRNCGGTDTIYGTWAFSFPSSSCQDTPSTFQTKNDIMRRYRMEEKQLDRYQAQFRPKLFRFRRGKFGRRR